MAIYPIPSKINSPRSDVESEDEREEQSSRRLFFAEQRAELPKSLHVEDQPWESSERVSTPEDLGAISSKKKFKWNAAFGVGKAKTAQV